ncbi:flavin-containing monooxygenase 5-like [Symsagittifera roscoffensis]|uniref:flavin-containing monooxygenase 5-like n=1 Tax=Symsagittifera roscoffensis TaxID=84072 RepID=UPI00307C0D12
MSCVLLEATDKLGGLWTYRKDMDYGAMSFTHINVSKYNYCFSDFPFPDSQSDYPSHSVFSQYIRDYALHFNLLDFIHFNHRVTAVKDEGKEWRLEVEISHSNSDAKILKSDKLLLATGHHVTPKYVQFPGIDTFPGKIIHSCAYKNAHVNQLEGKSVLVVGIGNSAVDAATDLANRDCKVHLSTRSGAWIIPNYIHGHPTDLYASRFVLSLPWKCLNFILESVISFIFGSPHKWGLNPRMRALQTQPTVSATFIHYTQRQFIRLKGNIQEVQKSTVTFNDGTREEFDAILMCTGYDINLDFLDDQIKRMVLNSKRENEIELYKQVFSPQIGTRLGFIGFVQPSSGGVLMCSEVQAQWFVALCRNLTHLPDKQSMIRSIESDRKKSMSRYYDSPRHTIQVDPIVYCDELSRTFGGKPEVSRHLGLARRLLFGSCGPAQYRLQGPFKTAEAKKLRQFSVANTLKISAKSTM